MSKVSCKRLGMALVGLAVPFMFVAPVAAQPAPQEVSAVELLCLNYLDISTCSHAVSQGVIDVVEGEVNADLAAQGVAYTVDVGEPIELTADINDIAVNPLPPMIPVPAVPGVPFQ